MGEPSNSSAESRAFLRGVVRVSSLFLSRGRLRAGWRVLLFLVVSFGAASLLSWLLAPFRTGGTSVLFVGTLAAVLGLLVGSWAMMVYVERLPFGAVGLYGGRAAVGHWGLGALLGAACMGASSALLLASGGLSVQGAAGTLGAWLSGAAVLTAFTLVAAAAEELLFRGYAFQVLVERWGVAAPLAFTAALFSLAHLFNPEVTRIGLFNLLLAGVLLGAAYLRTRSLSFVIGLHFGWNWTLAVPFDQPVSGLHFDMPGYDVRETGPDLLTGGAFGPEGGLVVTVVTLAAILWVWRTRRIEEFDAARALGPLVDRRLVPAPQTVDGC